MNRLFNPKEMQGSKLGNLSLNELVLEKPRSGPGVLNLMSENDLVRMQEHIPDHNTPRLPSCQTAQTECQVVNRC